MKPFKTIDEQIEILKDRHLKFINEEAAKSNLISYGYYEIVNGYKDYLLLSSNPIFLKMALLLNIFFPYILWIKGFKKLLSMLH